MRGKDKRVINQTRGARDRTRGVAIRPISDSLELKRTYCRSSNAHTIKDEREKENTH